MTFDKQMLTTLKYWIVERENMRKAKEAGLAKPWTNDRLLAMHRWCNVRRMDDKVSRWLMEHWYIGATSPRSALLAAALARLINWPDTLQYLLKDTRKGGFRKWNAVAVRNKLTTWQLAGNKVFTGAYIINGAAGGSKVDQVVRHVQHMATRVLKPDGRPLVQGHSMMETWAQLKQCPGIGSFMAGQIVADLRHVCNVKGWWEDRYTWAPLGPGSTRGMRRLLGLPARGAMKQSMFDDYLPALINDLQNDRKVGVIYKERGLEAMDIQNCLCEMDKLVRLREGGHVRSNYPGGF